MSLNLATIKNARFYWPNCSNLTLQIKGKYSLYKQVYNIVIIRSFKIMNIFIVHFIGYMKTKTYSYYSNQSISQSLPQTAYLKLIDVWLMFCLLVPFGIFLIEIVWQLNLQSKGGLHFSGIFVSSKSHFTVYNEFIISKCSLL